MQGVFILSEIAGPVPLVRLPMATPEEEQELIKQYGTHDPEALKIADEMRREPLNIPTY